MLSGLRPVLCAGLFLLLLSSLLATGVPFILNHRLAAFTRASLEDSSQQLPGTSGKGSPRRRGKVWAIFAAVVIFALWLIRPSEPYNHLTGALPFTLFYALLANPSSTAVADNQSFPFPELLNPMFWEAPKGHYRGWAPGNGESIETDDYPNTLPRWASPMLPSGFERWALESDDARPVAALESDDEDEIDEDETQYYDPVNDPLRITNLDHDLLEPLQQALGDRDVPITHVMLIIMESARKDVFPMKSGSHLYEKILDSYIDQRQTTLDEVKTKLSHLSPVAEILTGESSGFPARDPSESPNHVWNDTAAPGMGGINVNGMLTGSSLSFKSALVNYCGVGPLPVDFMMEADSDIYQPCIMQIFNLFNKLKGSSTNATREGGQGLDAIQDRKWKSTFFQSITEQYDKQNVLNRNMGFDKSICREQISNRRAKHYHSGMEEINYFGLVPSSQCAF